jgi:hypothetical protein
LITIGAGYSISPRTDPSLFWNELVFPDTCTDSLPVRFIENIVKVATKQNINVNADVLKKICPNPSRAYLLKNLLLVDMQGSLQAGGYDDNHCCSFEVFVNTKTDNFPDLPAFF